MTEKKSISGIVHDVENAVENTQGSLNKLSGAVREQQQYIERIIALATFGGPQKGAYKA